MARACYIKWLAQGVASISDCHENVLVWFLFPEQDPNVLALRENRGNFSSSIIVTEFLELFISTTFQRHF